MMQSRPVLAISPRVTVNSHQIQRMLTGSKARVNLRKRNESEEIEIVGVKIRTPENKFLKIENVVETILSFLDVKSLKAARQVNKLFSSEGAKLLITKCYVQIPLNLQSAESSTKKKAIKKFKAFLSYKSTDVSMVPRIILKADDVQISSDLQNAESSTKDEKMAKFKAFLANKSSDVSMIPKITVKADPDLELWKSLGVLGKQVNSVKLNIIDDEQVLLKKVLKLLPNLKYLKLVNKENNWLEGIKIMKILTSAMSKPEKKNGSLLVSSFMSMQANNVEEFEELENLSDCRNIMIVEGLLFGTNRSHSQSVPQYEARYANIISKFLSASQNTLKKLVLQVSEICLPLVQFPCLSSLNALKFTFWPSNPVALPHYRFSPSFRISDSVPNLDSVELNCECVNLGANFFASFFETTGSAPSVQILTYAGSPVGSSVVGPLFQNFPNINTFHMYDAGKNMFRNLCKHAGNIKWLKVFINLDDVFGQVANLDSMLTGLASETVNWMKMGPKNIAYTADCLEEIRVHPSVLDLKELKSLIMEFYGTGRNFLPERTLAIAAKCAFKMMPEDSMVCIRVEDTAPAIARARTALDEVSKLPNVTVKFVEKTI